MPEGRRLFARLTVEENLLLARYAGRTGAWTLDAVMEAFPNLKDRRRSARRHFCRAASSRRPRSAARLMTNPELLLLDEVSLGLSPLAVDRVYASLEALKSSGVADAARRAGPEPRAWRPRAASSACWKGAIALEGPTRALTREQVTEAYFGLRRHARRGAAALIWLNQIIQGVLLGGYYALIACGLSFMFGVMGIINLAHGSLAVLAAYALFVLADRFGISAVSRPHRSSLPLMARDRLGAAAPGARAQRARRAAGADAVDLRAVDRHRQPAVRGLRRRHPLARALYRRSLLRQLVAHRRHRYRQARGADLRGRGRAARRHRRLFLNRTPIGRAIRATAEDPDTVGLVGINARRVNAIAAAIALATVGVAGAFLGMRATFDPYAGAAQLIFAFEAAVIGGAGSLWGTLVGGIVLGVAQSLGAQINPQGFLIAGHFAVPRRAVRAPVLAATSAQRVADRARGGAHERGDAVASSAGRRCRASRSSRSR